MALKVVLAGGGTAGHVNPLLAVAQELRSREHQVSVIGTEEGLEAQLVPQNGFELLMVPKVPLPRKPGRELIVLPGQLMEAVDAAQVHLQGADVLVGFGGYVSAPAYLAARKMGIPIVVQEQNVKPGIANRMAAPFAKAVSLAFPETKLSARRGITAVTGLPLRKEITNLARERKDVRRRKAARQWGAEQLGLNPDLPTLLVTGGSLGAQHLNTVAAEGSGLVPANLQVIHLTGHGKSAEVLRRVGETTASRWLTEEYLLDMTPALAAADLVLCRSGAGTVAELGVLGLPAFYVPLPIGNGEQRRNSQAQVRAGGARLVEDKDFDRNVFLREVVPLTGRENVLRRMGEAMRKVTPAGGAVEVADLAERQA